MADPQFSSEAVDWSDIGYQVAHGVAKRIVESDLRKNVISTLAEKEAVVAGLVFDVLVDIALKLGEGMHKLEAPILPLIAGFVAPIVGGLFGASVNEGQFARRLASGEGAAAGQAIVDGLFRAIAGDAAAGIEPSDVGARRIASAAVQASLESTFNAIVPEMLSDLIGEFGPRFHELTELPEGIIRTLGVSRLVRQALRPLIATTCATPMQWHIDKLHRPTLLTHGDVARQLARGRWQIDQAKEELARQGYSDDRIEALLNSVAKFRSPPDVFRLVRAGSWSDTAGLQHLKDQGYDDAGAGDELLLEKLKAIESFERSMASAAVDAYVAGRIDEGSLGGFVTGATISDQEKAQYVELAHARRELSLTPLSPAEASRLAKAKILSVIDYRQALERDGRTEDAITALELELRAELDNTRTVEQHRIELQAEKDAAAKAKAAAAAAKAAQVAQQQALARRGKPADLERAAIRGLIPLSRVQEIYDATYDGDTVAILMDLLEGQRQDYLAQQQARVDAAKRAAVRGISVPEIEAAVLAGVLTLGEYRTRLSQLNFSADDAGVLAATLQAKIDDRDAAQQAHDQAVAAAKVKHVPLSTIETLVRRGHRTMADYDATLQDLGFDDGARAAMEDLLQDTIDQDAKARAERDAAANRPVIKGLTLEQMRRAVLIGASTIDAFQTYLVDNKYTADAQIVLLAELRADVDEAEAARQRRAEADAAKDSRDAPIADVARAARLGLISVAAYTDRLTRAGYTDDAIALELDLLVQERADAADAQRQQDAANAATAGKGLSLAQTAAAVKDGLSSIAAYVATAQALGYAADAAATLGRLLQDQIDADQAAQLRHDALAAAAAQPDPTLAQLEAGVINGLLTFDDFVATLQARGYASDDVELLAGLLDVKLQKAANK